MVLVHDCPTCSFELVIENTFYVVRPAKQPAIWLSAAATLGCVGEDRSAISWMMVHMSMRAQVLNKNY